MPLSKQENDMATELQVGNISFGNMPYCTECLQPINNHLPQCKYKSTENSQDSIDDIINKLFQTVEHQRKLFRMLMDRYKKLHLENADLLKRLEKYENT
jgi:hypothetical protein